MKEKVVTLGENRNLIGILSDPDEPLEGLDRPAILLLNAGMVHRVGPFRINTQLARKLAAAGYTSFRFDLAGIGDSEIDKNALPQDEQMIKDVGIVINYFQEVRQIERIVIIGLCTGADNAHKAAMVYKQITGAIFLDGYAYPTAKFFYNRLLPVIADPKRLAMAIARRIISAFSWIKQQTRAVTGSADDGVSNLFIWDLPSKGAISNDLKELLERKTPLCYFYTNGSFYTYNYLNQFRAAFNNIDFGNLLTEYYFPQMDHTYILKQDREKLMLYILKWLDRNYGNNVTVN